MNLLDVMSGNAALERQNDLGRQNAIEEMRNRTLFDTMVENRQEKRIKTAMGSAPTPGQYLLPPDQEGPQVFGGPGTGLFGTPEEQIMAQALMANINPSAFASSYTNTMGAPAAFSLQELKGQQALDKQDRGRLGEVRKLKSGDQEISAQVVGFEPNGMPIYENLESGDLFSPHGQAGAYTTVNDLRKEFNALPEVKDYKTVTKQVGRVDYIEGMLNNLANAPKEAKVKGYNAIDQGLINILNKMLDENSVVRESEYARTPEGEAILNRLAAYPKKLQKGGAGLSDEGRRDIISAIRAFRSVADDIYEGVSSYYRDIAKSEGLPGDLVIKPPEYQKGQSLRGTTHSQTPEALPAEMIAAGWVDNGDGTAYNPSTGETARMK